jgi:hypothetical protein
MDYNNDLGSLTVYDTIKDASMQVFESYGDPVKKTVFRLDGVTGVSGVSYNFTGDMGPVYQVREVYVGTADLDLVSSEDYEVDFANGTMKFTEAFLNTNNGKNVYVHWVPSLINLLVKYTAAHDLLSGEMTFSGAQNKNPMVTRLEERLESIREALRPKGLFAPKHLVGVGGYELIPQDVHRGRIYFNY